MYTENVLLGLLMFWGVGLTERVSSGMLVSTTRPARCGTMTEALNVAFRPGSSKHGKADRAPVASNCVTIIGGVCGEGAEMYMPPVYVPMYWMTKVATAPGAI